MNESLDDPKDDQLTVPMQMVQWWEKKRLVFNLIILPITALIIWSMWEYVGLLTSASDIIFDAFWTLVWCNVFYTSGWVGGILRHYYFRSYSLPTSGRWILFGFGTLYTLIILEIRFSELISPMLRM